MADLNKKLKWVLFDVLQDISKKHGHDTVIYLPLDGSKGYTAKDLANGIVEGTDVGQQYADDLINIVIDLLRRRAKAQQIKTKTGVDVIKCWNCKAQLDGWPEGGGIECALCDCITPLPFEKEESDDSGSNSGEVS